MRSRLLWVQVVALLACGFALLPGSAATAQSPVAATVWLPIIMRPSTGNPLHQGIATFYGATGAGACSFDPSPNDLLVAAMNAEEYNTASVCGAYVLVNGPKGSVMVRICARPSSNPSRARSCSTIAPKPPTAPCSTVTSAR